MAIRPYKRPYGAPRSPLVGPLGDALRGGLGGGGGGPSAPSLPATLADSFRSGGASLADPAVWVNAGTLARNITKTTNNPIDGVPIDGMPTIDTSGGAANLETATGTLTQAFVGYYIVRTRGVTTTQLIMDSDAGSFRVTVQVVSSGVFRGNAGTNISTAANTLLADTVYLLRVEVNGATSELQVGDVTGASVALTANIGSTNLAGLSIGASNAGASSFQGDIAEVHTTTLANDDPAAMLAWANYYFPSTQKYTWAPEDVTWIGDSNFVGQGSTDGRGSRSIIRERYESLTTDIEQGVRRLRFAGAVADRCMSHSSYSGRPITVLRDNAAAAVATLPTYAVIMIGTNDCRNNGATYDGTLTPAALGDALTNLRTASPATKYILFTPPPMTNSTFNANVNDLISKTPALVTAAQGAGMVLRYRNTNAELNAGTHLDPDGIHLNDAGHLVIADAIEEELRASA